jgi:hypothetical protein
MGLERLLCQDAEALSREVSTIDKEGLLGEILAVWAGYEDQEQSGIVAEGAAGRPAPGSVEEGSRKQLTRESGHNHYMTQPLDISQPRDGDRLAGKKGTEKQRRKSRQLDRLSRAPDPLR